MPVLLKFIDAIARQKGRDVLFVRFGELDAQLFPVWFMNFDVAQHDWENDPNRRELISWLDERGITWSKCGCFANENIMCGYWGDIYIDIPYDTSNSVYQELASRLENLDETRKIPGVTFCCVTLKSAMRNAHHDEPGFWEKFAEDL